MPALRQRNGRLLLLLVALPIISLLSSCDGGDPRNDQTGVESATATSNCDGRCASTSAFLSLSDVGIVIAQAVAEAQARNLEATIAVVDRTGNVLGVFQMGTGADVIVSSGGAVSGGLEGISIVPARMAAISKALTAAYLSTEGNAFSTRTLGQLVQENFNPGERGQAAGPLFGVQFSQLPCSDFNTRHTIGANAGPKRSTLGLATDPGGFPLYKFGSVVGGVGVASDAVYGLDKNITDVDADTDELIAWAGTRGYAAPLQRRADRIALDGRSLRFSDISFAHMRSTPADVQAYVDLNGSAVGAAVNVDGYFDAAVLQGTAFGTPTSGVRADSLDFDATLDAFVLVDNGGGERFRPRAGGDAPAGIAGNALSAAEVKQILSSALDVANRTRSQLRRPLGSAARVAIAVVDSEGRILGLLRSRDAPTFADDSAVQKARSAAFLSRSGNTVSPADTLRLLPLPEYLDGASPPAPLPGLAVSFADYVSGLQDFTLANMLESTGTALAFSGRVAGNLARPHYPDGSTGGAGPLSKTAAQWSVFSTGLQSDLIHNALLHHISYVRDSFSYSDVIQNCTGSDGLTAGFVVSNLISGLANGLQFSSGSVPVYRGDVLVGAIGVAGDGPEQDDMIAFLGLQQAGEILSASSGNAPGNAPKTLRADTLSPQGNRLTYVACPMVPWRDSSQQNVCAGL